MPHAAAVPPSRLCVAVLLAIALSACTAESSTDAGEPASVSASPSPSPEPAPTLSAEVDAACAHIELATRAQARHDWKTVTAELFTAWRVGHTASDRTFARMLPPPDAFFPDDTQTIGEETDTLAVACGLPFEPVAGSPAGSPTRPTFELSATSVAGVRIGTAAADAERQLRERLGAPDETTALPGCEGEEGTQVKWGIFTVVLSNEGHGPVLLRGWSLRWGSSHVRFTTPYDVQIGDPIRDALRRVPEAVGVDSSGEDEGGYVVSTKKVPQMFWIATSIPSAKGDVDEISYNDPGCD